MSYNVMGEDYSTMGDDEGVEGEYQTVGAPGMAAQFRRGRGMTTIRLPPRPAWRQQLAPGVPEPGQGLEPLPLTPSEAGGVFAPAGATIINWEARPQAPFRPERLIALVRRSGDPALIGGISLLTQGLFVGRNLQQVELGPLDLEFFGPGAFGVRLNLVQAEPGVLIRIAVTPSAPIPAATSIAASLTFLGRTMR